MKHFFFKKPFAFLLIGCLSFAALGHPSAFAAETSSPDNTRLHDFLSKVYDTMDQHYYLPIQKKSYDEFLLAYPAEKLIEINKKSKQTADFVHLGAGLLVNKLKHSSDKFTNFVPPDKSKAFKESAYAVTEDLGIEGTKNAQGFLITRVQKHCDAYLQGIRPGDVLLAIDGLLTTQLDEKTIRQKLSPVSGSKTTLRLLMQTTKKIQEIILESKSYFKETVSIIETEKPGILIIKISHFNQKTSEDFSEQMKLYSVSRIKHLVIDLRNNGGGPPLAAREILGFFLPPNDMLFAIARKKKRPVMLTAPTQPISYQGPVSILVDHKTGSAAEMFSGMLQAKQKAILIGQKTAGATYLKSIYDLEDGSMVFMITSLTFFYDRRVYPADGLTPDILLDENVDGLKIALDKIL